MDLETLTVKDPSELHRWLEEHHARTDGVWLIINKKDVERPGVYYEEVVEEALCFGWIDGRIYRLDEKRYLQHLSPRRPGGTWSKSNKDRIEKLIGEGRMTPAGVKRIEAAKKDGSWNALDRMESLEVPGDLREAIGWNTAAADNFKAWPESYRMRVLWWIESAKRDVTRSNRIEQTAAAAEQNRKPFE